jgi:DNA invertase Pin-like site-specific DNA recombinase
MNLGGRTSYTYDELEKLELRAAAYVRVSSPAQSLVMQEVAIEKAAFARGEKIENWYREKASAKVDARPGRDLLMQAARAGEFQRLYVYRLDRLSRGGIRDTLDVVEQLTAAGVELVTLADGFDLHGPAAEIVLAVLAWAAKMERLAINERIASARARVAAEGKPWGRPPRLTAAEVEKIQKLHADGHTVRYIAQTLRTPRSTVFRALSHKVAREKTRSGLVRTKVLRGVSR